MKMYQTLNNQNVTSNNAQRIFQKYISEVRQNYIKERTIEFYASKLCVSPKYLGQMVMKASGRSALSWINDYIILEAKALLKSKRYNVQEVSFMLNFANPSFFGKFFKSKTGVTPREYMIG
jgi:YesN/AraC family two-component response regulator